MGWKDAPEVQTQGTAPAPTQTPAWQSAPEAQQPIGQTAALKAIQAGGNGAVGKNEAGLTPQQQAEQGMSHLDDFARVLANSATLGGADRLAGAAASVTGIGGPPSHQGQRNDTLNAEQRLGPGGTAVADALGAIAQNALIPGTVVSTLPRAIATGAVIGGGTPIAQSLNENGTLPSAAQVGYGTILGAGLGAAGNKIGSLFQKPKLNPTQEAQARILNDAGVDVTRGQATGVDAFRKAEGAASGADEFMQKQQRQFSAAVAQKVGINAPDGAITAPKLNQAFSDVGSTMDNLSSQYGISDPNILAKGWSKLYGIAKDYHNGVGAQAAPIINRTVQRIAQATRNGKGLTGEDYQSITSDLAKAARNNDNLKSTAYDMRRTIDDMMEQSITAANPADASKWSQARTQYKNLLTVENALGRAAQGTASDLIDPQSLAAATKATQGKRNYVRDKTEFDQLADAGRAMLTRLPSGGGAMNLRDIKNLGLSAAGYGSLGMFHEQSPIGAALAMAPLAGGALKQMSGIDLLPYSRLSPVASAIGGKVGIGMGQNAAGNQNPFTKARGL